MNRHEPEPGYSATGARIRAAIESDAAEVQAIADETWRATYADILPEEAIGQFLVDSYSVPAIGRRMAAADRFEVAVSEADDSIVGFSEWLPGATTDERVWAATYVRPGWQRRGIGRWFMESAVAGYRGRTKRLLVVVAEANVNGVAFYQAMGFVPVERLASGIYGTPVSELRLAKLID